MSVEPAEVEWEPGDPLYSRSHHPHSCYLFNFRAMSEAEESCDCGDAASWPAPFSGHALGDGDELGALIARVRGDQQVQQADELLTTGCGLPLMPWQRRVLRRYLGGAG